MASDAAYADLLPALSPLEDPDAAMLDRKATMAKLLGTDGQAAPPSWLDQIKAGMQDDPTQTASAAPPAQPAAQPTAAPVPAGVTPSGSVTKPSLSAQNAATIGTMQGDYGKASQDVQREADQPDIGTQTASLEAQRAKDAAPINAYDPTTGKLLAAYKPSFGQRLMRGAEGVLRGGVLTPAAILGAIDPTAVGGTAYGAPNAQLGRDQQQQQGRVASDDQQLQNAAANWKSANERLKQVANDRRALATMGKDVTGANVEQQKVPIDQQNADTGSQNADTAAAVAYNNSPAAKAATTQAEFEAAQKQADTLGLKGTNRTLFLANGKIPDPRQATSEDIALSQATAAWHRDNPGKEPGLKDVMSIRQAIQGKTAGTQMMVPDGKGGMTLTNVQPGDVVPQGATTVKGMDANNKNAEKESNAAQAIVDEAELAHESAAEAEKGNAEGDVDLALSFFKTIKGTNGTGIRFTQAEQNLIKGARNTAGDIKAVAQKVVGGGQSFTTDQRNNILKIIDIHANAAKKHVGGGSSPADNGAPPPGAKVRDYSTLGSH